MFTQGLKVYARRSLLIIIIALLSLLSLFQLGQVINNKLISQNQVLQNQKTDKVSPGLPVRLLIPAINVNARIQHTGITSQGKMEVPDNTVDGGWFKLGPRPGENGSAVIAGHFDGENNNVGVFTNLLKLKKGDKIYIKDDKGIFITFSVRENRIYDPGYADDVFSRSDGRYLNLVTCDGVWDGTKKSYTKRLVVFTDIVKVGN